MIKGNKLSKYTDALEGISFNDWIKVKIVMDRFFDKKIGEHKKILVFSEAKTVSEIIRQEFGER